MLGTLLALVVAALLEVGGDAAIRRGLSGARLWLALGRLIRWKPEDRAHVEVREKEIRKPIE